MINAQQNTPKISKAARRDAAGRARMACALRRKGPAKMYGIPRWPTPVNRPWQTWMQRCNDRTFSDNK